MKHSATLRASLLGALIVCASFPSLAADMPVKENLFFQLDAANQVSLHKGDGLPPLANGRSLDRWLDESGGRRVAVQPWAGGRPIFLTVLGVVLLAASIFTVVVPKYSMAVGPESLAQGSDIPYEPYSREKLLEAQAAGKPVFVNYTAAWCVTCQVNEKVAFSTRQVAEAFSKTGTVYLKADWTRRDAKIAAELAEYGRAGVPLYLVYGPHGGEPTILPQLLTGPIVARALESAAAR